MAYPAILQDGRLWAEEGRDFLSYAFRRGSLAALVYVHKRHLDLIPNLAASISAWIGGRSALHVFPAVSVLGYIAYLSGFARLAAASVAAGSRPGLPAPPRSAWMAISLVCGLTGALTAVHPRAWEAALNTINSWSLLVPALVLHVLAPARPRVRGLLAFAAGVVSFPVLLLLPGFLLFSVAGKRCQLDRSGQFPAGAADAVSGGLFLALLVQLGLMLVAPSELPLATERSFSLQVLPLVPLLAVWRSVLPLLLPLPSALPAPLISPASVLSAGSALLAAVVVFLVLLAPWLVRNPLNAIPGWFLPALSLGMGWQLIALALSFGGVESYVAGGGFRYVLPFFLLVLAGVVCTIIQHLAHPSRGARGLLLALLLWLVLQAGSSLAAQWILRRQSPDWWCFRHAPVAPYPSQVFSPAGSLPLCPLGWP